MLVDASGDQRTTIVHSISLITDAVSTLKRFKRALKTSRLVSVHRKEWLALAHRIARLRMKIDACRVLNRVLLARSTSA